MERSGRRTEDLVGDAELDVGLDVGLDEGAVVERVDEQARAHAEVAAADRGESLAPGECITDRCDWCLSVFSSLCSFTVASLSVSNKLSCERTD